MKTEKFKSEHANYTLYVDRENPKQPFTIFLHGGPGFNNYGERTIFGPHFGGKLNFLWFDLLGSAESPAHSSEHITWQNKISDVVAIVKKFADGPVNIIGHCLGAHLTHDIVRSEKKLVKRVVWYSPANSVATIFKGILTRSLIEGRLPITALSDAEKESIIHFNSTFDENFGSREVMTVLTLAGKIQGFQEMYWSDKDAMARYEKYMAEHPVNFEAFARLQTQFFMRGLLPVPDYSGIPVMSLYSDDDHIAPWDINGALVMKNIKNGKSHLIPGGSHWIHQQKPAETAKHTLEFLLS